MTILSLIGIYLFKIFNVFEDREWEKLVKVLGTLETDRGDTNNTSVWREMKKAFPNKSKPVPTGVNNIENKTVTNPTEKKTVILNHFLHRMRNRPVNKEVREILEIKMETFKLRLAASKSKKSPPICMK